MDYKQTINYLFKKLPMYQNIGKSAYKEDIGNIKIASRKLGNPHLKFKSIHVAGTNGKGSVSHMLASIMQEAGYKVGLYTSPHLKDFRERIKINGKEISKREVVNFIQKYKTNFENIDMSFFEMTVSLAFHHFSKHKVDISIIECGLGGRLDSTNIIKPEISVITNIGFDHMSLLGNHLEEIAFEKAGIIKKGVPVVIGKKQKNILHVFENKVRKEKSNIIFAKDYNYECDLKGNYQLENINTAVTTIKNIHDFEINEEQIEQGLKNIIKNTNLLGRWQILCSNPLTICDTAHNQDGMERIVSQINSLKYENLHIVLGVCNDKNIDNILSLLPIKAKYYFCEAKIPRSMNKVKLQIKAKRFNLSGEVFTSVKSALKEARYNAKKNDMIYIGGSTFVVSEII